MNIIQTSLTLIRDRLNEYFQAADPSPDAWVTLSNIVEQNGQMLDSTRNKIVIFLANIQQDTTISTWNPAKPVAGAKFVLVPPPLYVNLYLLIYANFGGHNYPQGVGMISKAIQFFQENPYFTHRNLPGLPTAVDQLAFELTNLDAVGLSYLMGLAGVKYLPSLYYKVRTFPFQSDVVQQQAPAAQGYAVPGAPSGLPPSQEGRAS
jgi:hypothetical protein